jgi:hypothetical protein
MCPHRVHFGLDQSQEAITFGREICKTSSSFGFGPEPHQPNSTSALVDQLGTPLVSSWGRRIRPVAMIQALSVGDLFDQSNAFEYGIEDQTVAVD